MTAHVESDAPDYPRSSRADLPLILALIRRDLLRLRRDTGRWLGLVIQPLLLWALLGSGFGDVFKVPNLDVDYHRFFFPGLVVMVGLFTAIFATMAVIEDRDRGFLQQILVSPASRAAMVVGKVLGVLAIALAQFALIAPAASLAGYDLTQVDYGLLFLAYILGTAGTTALAFALAWVCPTTHAYHALMGVLLIPLWLVSGSMFPMPDTGWISVVGALNPLTYAVDGLRHGFEGHASPLATTSPTLSFCALLAFVALSMGLAIFVSRGARSAGHGGRG